jgi:hypothetical protein
MLRESLQDSTWGSGVALRSGKRGDEMSVSGAIEVAIGLVFTYFVFSSVCSGLNEGFARIVNLRGWQLFKSINALIGDIPTAEAFWQHDLITGLSKTRSKAANQAAGGPAVLNAISAEGASILSKASITASRVLPSYISPKTVATVIKDVAAAPAPEGTDPQTGIRKVVASITTNAHMDEQRIQGDLEKWFNDAMDRLSGWYKRFVQAILLGLAVVVTVGFNVNSIHIAQELWTEPSVQAAVTQAATTAVPVPGQGQAAPPAQSLKSIVNEASPLPVGWGSGNLPRGHWGWALAILGWLLTIGALTLGAPFWFDLLTRMNSLRSTGPPAKT